MEKWLKCWQCGHETPQERRFYQNFWRAPELFTKKDDGSVREKLYASLISTHAMYICTRCQAPNYYVHEYWPTGYGAEPATNESCATQESQEFLESIRKKGVWDKDKLFRIYHYPQFGEEVFPEWTKQLPTPLMNLVWEVYAAQYNGLNRLALMGIRAIVDVFAVAKLGDVGSFNKKLKGLKEGGHVSNTQYSALEILVDSGNASAHRGFSPAPEQVSACLEVVESIFFFEGPNHTLSSLRDATPQRQC